MNSFDDPAFFHQLFHGIPEAITILDDQDRVIVVNRQFEKTFGYALEDIRGHRINDLVLPAEYLDEGIRYSRLVLSGTPLVNVTGTRRRADGSHVHVSITARPIFLEGRQAAILVMYRDISDQIILLDSIDTHIWYLKEPGMYGAVNQAHAEFYGFAKHDMQNRRMEEFFGPEKAAPLEEHNRDVFERDQPATVERWTRRADGEIRLLKISKKPCREEAGQIRYVVCTAEDITELRRQENRLRLLSSMVEQSADPMIHFDSDYRISYMNPAAERQLGWTLDELRGEDPAIFNAEENSREVQEVILKAIMAGQVYEGRVRNRRKDGSVYVAQLRIAPIMDDQGEIIGFVDVKRDITAEQKELETKELLLREVQHRVKNNLATVVSLLTLQAGGVEDPVAVNALNDARRRIEAMLTVYEALHLTSHSGRIDLQTYLQDLIERLEETLHTPCPIEYLSDHEPTPIESSAAISLGMIVNELLTNAVKHAFPPDEPAREKWIRVELAREERESGSPSYRIAVADNGVAIPDNIDLENEVASLGLTLVKSLVQKLRGDLVIERNGGTRCTVTVPI
ncbi:MAG: PAS domain S-box protein [Spirochaetaceae bacterium]|nr:MAG: PAS domain S-box protein [Spirochaetaceae bacterium]